jgi:hypothetical protein
MRGSLLVALFLLSIPIVVLAQNLDCPTIVRDALGAVDNACADTERNQVCYGNIILSAEPQPGAQEFAFERTGDRISLGFVRSLTLSPMDAATNVWGVALMKVQANLPDTLPGQNVTFLMFGDVTIDNAGDSATVLTPVTIIARNQINIRSGPSKGNAVLGSLASGQVVTATGRNAVGDWLYGQFGEQSGWVFAQLVTIEGDINLLSIIETDNTTHSQPTAESQPIYGPMQAFYFKTGRGDAPCAEAPDSGILIQTPSGAAQIDLLANEVRITLGSTVYLQAQPGGDMLITVVGGQATVSAFGATVIAPAGTRVRIPVDNDLKASGPPAPLESYQVTDVAALPVTYLPDVITVALPLSADEIDALTLLLTPTASAPDGGLPASGQWCPTATGCSTTVLPSVFGFTFEDDGAVLILTYEGGADRYIQVEPGVYLWTDGSAQAVLRIISSTQITIEYTLPGREPFTVGWTLLEAN